MENLQNTQKTRKKGVRNLQKRLDRDYEATLDELRAEGFIVVEYPETLNNFFCEKSKECITPKNDDTNSPCKWLDENGYHFGLDYYTLFGFDNTLFSHTKIDDLDNDKNYVVWNSIEPYCDFQNFADNLNDFLKEKNCIMQTWKYKQCVIAPKPKLVFSNYDEADYPIEVYKPPKVNEKTMKEIVQEIHCFAFENLVWDETTKFREQAKKCFDEAVQDLWHELEYYFEFRFDTSPQEYTQKNKKFFGEQLAITANKMKNAIFAPA